MLMERLVGDGVYWRLKHLYDNMGRGSDFGAEVGSSLESHLLEVVADSIGRDPSTDVYGQVSYRTTQGTEHGPDIVIWKDGTLVFVEVGANRCNYARVILQGDVDAYAGDIDRILISASKKGRARQLDRKVKALRSGQLTYPWRAGQRSRSSPSSVCSRAFRSHRCSPTTSAPRSRMQDFSMGRNCAVLDCLCRRVRVSLRPCWRREARYRHS